MRKSLPIIMGLAILLSAASCTSTRSATGTRMASLAPLKRSEYKITKDYTQDAQVTSWFWGLFNSKNKTSNYYQGRVGDANSNEVEPGFLTKMYRTIIPQSGNRAGDLALYTLINEHPELDYVTNVRVYSTVSNWLIFKQYKVTVKAKGIILNKD